MMLGQKIKELREKSGLKQRELAYRLGIGEGFLSKVENCQKPLKRDDLYKLHKIFNVELDYLESLWLANKIFILIKNEATAEKVLEVVNEQLSADKFKK